MRSPASEKLEIIRLVERSDVIVGDQYPSGFLSNESPEHKKMTDNVDLMHELVG
jgi:hypothetical protein